ncbi:MAG: shikimate dehydrogenase family protein [Gemmatimonadales bacterium]
MTAIAGSTRVFAILGDPVEHSLSPRMHNAAFTALGLDAVYVPLRCRSADVGPLMRSLAAQGGGGNVTVPHKRTAAEVLDGHGRDGLSVINTFWGERGSLRGTETDSQGILAALDALGVYDGSWCLIGTGGSATAALEAARIRGAGIAVRSRTPDRAARFLDAAGQAGIRTVEPADCELVINCTPLGLQDGDPLPLPPAEMPRDATALDLVYRRGLTEWVRALRALGIRAADGREVLLGQGVAAFACWFPGLQAPTEVMRAAIQGALG